MVELTAFEKITPLASGYLCAYAANDPELAANYTFRICDAPVTVEREKLVEELVGQASDVYGLTCYVWNMGIVRWLLDRLVRELPAAQFILGGSQVMEQAGQYVPQSWSNVVVCNGEGERSFHDYLRELGTDNPDLSRVPGISFWRDGELITTARPERIKDLNEVPSPYTTGLFEPGKYAYAVLETNRGCPYHCGFCFWGGATNAKVNRFETDRVLGDLEWISDNKFMILYLADANFGMLPRDVDITKHIIELRKRAGYPLMVVMNAAKNKPERMAEITKLLVGGGMLTSQPISLQSSSDGVLDLIHRTNIRGETYTELHRTLREEKISSYTEMIWPLPGETLDSYRRGLTKLCRSRADTILVYLQLLLNNTDIYDNRERFGIKVRRVADDAAEADVVVATKWVTEEEYNEGVWIFYSMQSIYCMRGLYYLANYLDSTGQMCFDELFARVARYFAEHQEKSAICRFFADSVANLGNYYILNSGTHAHMLMHGNRAEFDELLTDFVSGQEFWGQADARALFELDLLARPFIYREKPSLPKYHFAQLRINAREDGIEVTMPATTRQILRAHDLLETDFGEAVLLCHPHRRKLPFRPEQPLQESISYCQSMSIHLREILPEWLPIPVLAS